jgi:hypothetical protein
MAMADDLRTVRTDLMTALGRIERLIEASTEPKAAKLVNLLTMERTKAIEWVLRDNGGIMRPVEIWGVLQAAGRHDDKMSIQVATNGLSHRSRIVNVGRGEYRAKPMTAECGGLAGAISQ